MAAAAPGQIYDDIPTQLKKRVAQQAPEVPGAPAPALSPSADLPTAPAAVSAPTAAPVQATTQPINTTEPVAKTTLDGTTTTAGVDPNISAIEGFYTKYLGRAANPTDAQTWLSGGYGYGTDLATIENAIRSSDEARQYASQSGGGTPSATGSASQYLLQLLQGGMDRDQAIQQTRQTYNLPEGVDGSPLYYANNNTIGLKDAYLANVNGQWTLVPRGAEGAGGGGGTTGTQPGLGGKSDDPKTGGGYVDPLSPFTRQIREILMQRLALAQQPVDPNAPEIAQPFEAAKLQTDRGTQQSNAIAAESAYAAGARGGGGVDQGALARQGQQAVERGATGLSSVKAQLIQKAYAQKQDELQQDLQLALASGDAETAKNIQQALAQLQAQLTREGYGVQLTQIENTQNTYPFSFF